MNIIIYSISVSFCDLTLSTCAGDHAGDCEHADALAAMDLREGDFMDVGFFDWRRADLVFINATCFGQDMIDQFMKLSSEWI